MKINCNASCVETPVKNDARISSEQFSLENRINKERNSPSTQLKEMLNGVQRLHDFYHSPSILSVENLKLSLKTRNTIRDLFYEYDDEISDWVTEMEKTLRESGEFSDFVRDYLHYEYRVKKKYSICVYVLLNYMKRFSVGADIAFVEALKLSVNGTVCTHCFSASNSSVQISNLEYLKKFYSESDVEDSDGDPEFDLERECPEKVETSSESDHDSDNFSLLKENPLILTNMKEQLHCNPFDSDSCDDGNVFDFKEDLSVNPFASSDEENDFLSAKKERLLSKSPFSRTSSAKMKPQHNCEHCDKYFPNRYNLKLHYIQVHKIFVQGIEIYECQEKYCPFVTGSSGLFLRHVKTHSKKPRMKEMIKFKVSCKFCDISVANRSSLKRHMLRKHNK